MRRTAKKLVMIFEDESGYSFSVDAEELSPKAGWCGSVTLHTSGMNSAEAVLYTLSYNQLASWFVCSKRR